MRVVEGWEKVLKFTAWKYAEILYYWGELMNVTLDLHINDEQTHQTYDKKIYIKGFIKIIYAQTLCLKAFISLNMKIRHHCAEARYDYADPLLEKYYSVRSVRSEESEGLAVPPGVPRINSSTGEEKEASSPQKGHEGHEMVKVLGDLEEV